MRRQIVLLLTCLVMLSVVVGCAQQKPEPEGLQLYYTVSNEVVYGEAMAGEPYAVVGDEVDVIHLLTTLFRGPTDPTLTNPFPTGTRILWAGWREDGVLVLNLSEEYSGLMGIDLSLADYCIVRTLCQMEEVERVEILSANQENQFRHHQILSLEDIL